MSQKSIQGRQELSLGAVLQKAALSFSARRRRTISEREIGL